jgi:hypothetical protein
MLREFNLDNDDMVDFAMCGVDGLGIDGKMMYGDSLIFKDKNHHIIPITLP